MEFENNKRKKIFLSQKEIKILRNLFVKIIIPFVAVILISSILLFLGLKFLLQKANFMNYGIAPSTVLYSVSQFISIYVIIFIVNVILLLSLSAIIFFFMVHDLVFPIMRITNELLGEQSGEIQVRKTDGLLIPLVKGINRLIKARR